MRHGLDALLQGLVEFAQRFFRFKLLRNVGIGAKPADDFASFVADGQSA